MATASPKTADVPSVFVEIGRHGKPVDYIEMNDPRAVFEQTVTPPLARCCGRLLLVNLGVTRPRRKRLQDLRRNNKATAD